MLVVKSGASEADTGTGAPSRMRTMNRLGASWRPCSKGAGSRVFRIQFLNRLLAIKKDGLPATIFFDTCRMAIRAVPSVPRGDRNPEDIADGFPLLHAIGSVTYALSRGESTFGKKRLRGL